MQTERFPTPSGCWGRKMEIGDNGLLLYIDCIAWFELKVKERHDPGKHTLYIGEVICCGFRSAGTALCTMDYDGMYVGMD